MDCLQEILQDQDRLCRPKVELAAIVDVGKHFVAATYDLEGDGALSLSCYDRIQAVCNACQIDFGAMQFPCLRAVARDLLSTFPDITVAWAEEYGRSCV